jgi:hypothetical protein
MGWTTEIWQCGPCNHVAVHGGCTVSSMRFGSFKVTRYCCITMGVGCNHCAHSQTTLPHARPLFGAMFAKRIRRSDLVVYVLRVPKCHNIVYAATVICFIDHND